MQTTIDNLKPLIESLESYCIQIKLDVKVDYKLNENLSFNIKLNNKFSRNLSNSLLQNIINIKEDSFYKISAQKINGTINFTIISKKGEECKFLNNLQNFLKIIKLNKLYTTETDALEQTIPIKMVQTLKLIDEQKLPDFKIHYILSSNMLQIQNEIYSLDSGINLMNQLQNNPNYTDKFLKQNLQENYKLTNLKNFCKTVPISLTAIETISVAIN